MKRRIFKQILSGMLGIMLLLSLAGCGQSTANAKPTNTMEAFYDLLISQYINYLDIFKQAKQTTLDELKPLHIEKLSDAKKQLVSNVIDCFNSASVSSDMHSKTFTLKLQKIKSGDNTIHIFFPDNYEEVGSKLTQIVTNQ